LAPGNVLGNKLRVSKLFSDLQTRRRCRLTAARIKQGIDRLSASNCTTRTIRPEVRTTARWPLRQSNPDCYPVHLDGELGPCFDRGQIPISAADNTLKLDQNRLL